MRHPELTINQPRYVATLRLARSTGLLVSVVVRLSDEMTVKEAGKTVVISLPSVRASCDTLRPGLEYDYTVTLHLVSSHSSLFGATVTQWTCKGVERFYQSSLAKYDGSKRVCPHNDHSSDQIRAGIPICFV